MANEYRPFDVVRLRHDMPKTGPDRPDDVFAVQARGNHELVRTGESPDFALLNGSLGYHGRRYAQQLCDCLNEAWVAHYNVVESGEIE